MWDVVVVGGGPAGLSGALMLGRARRRVLVIDAGEPRNRFTDAVHAVLGRDGTSPAQLLADGRAEVESYGGVIRHATVSTVEHITDGFSLTLDESGADPDAEGTVLARRLLVATGSSDDLPDIPGLGDLWGRGVATCPYCDAYEVKDARIGILATGPASVMQAQLLRQWSESIIYVTHTSAAPVGEEAAGFAARGIQVAVGPVECVLAEDSRLVGVQLDGGRRIELDAIFTIPTLAPADRTLRSLGAAIVENPVGAFVQVDATGRTSIDGVWAAGNVVNPAANVPISIGAGALAGGAINHDLVLDDIARVLARSAQ